MDTTTWVLCGVLVFVVLFIVVNGPASEIKKESFVDFPVDLSALSTEAIDAAPSTDELKNHYKAFLIFIDDDIRKTAYKGLRLINDFGLRVYDRSYIRKDFKTSDVLADWPSWLPPMDTTIKEPVPSLEDATTAERKMLAYIARNFPQEEKLDSTSVTNSVVRNLITDFGYRFLFKKGKETAKVSNNFTPSKLLKGWVNPVTAIQPPVKEKEREKDRKDK